jgi:hypothetical protein
LNLIDLVKARIKDRKRVIDACGYPGCSWVPQGASSPVKEKAIRIAEESLEFPLPPLLREVYMQVEKWQ